MGYRSRLDLWGDQGRKTTSGYEAHSAGTYLPSVSLFPELSVQRREGSFRPSKDQLCSQKIGGLLAEMRSFMMIGVGFLSVALLSSARCRLH